MVGDEYKSAIRGGLRLKGAAASGVKKKKKSKPSVPSSATASSALQVAASSKSDTRTVEEKEADKQVLVEKKRELESKLSMLEDNVVDTKGAEKYQRDHDPSVFVEIRETKEQLEKVEGLLAAASDPTIAKVVIEDRGEEEERGYKTEAQKRQEEMKRKRLEEKFEREGGVKTHKERLEELNRYLSGLSEHHDMPKIGPG